MSQSSSYERLQDEIGVVYVATNDKLFREAAESAKILQKKMDIDITVFTDKDRELSRDKDVTYNTEIIDAPEFGFKDKIEGMRQSPYERTLYLDTDIYVTSDIMELFFMLDSFDLAVAHDVARCESLVGEDVEPDRLVQNVPRSFPEHNTGVVVYKSNGSMDQFLSEWGNEYRNDEVADQPSFRRTLYMSDIRYATLPPEYNYFTPSPVFAHGKVRIIHHRILDIDTLGGAVKLNVKDFASDINGCFEKRVSFRDWNGMKVLVPKKRSPPLIYRIKKSIQNDGVVRTLTKAVGKIFG